MPYSATYITGGAFDTVVIDKDGEFVTAYAVDRQAFEDFQSDNPEWENWHGEDDDVVDIDYQALEEYYGGPVIADRKEDEPINILDPDRWAEREHFWNRTH